MKIQTPTILTILSVILLGFLVFFNLKDTQESEFLQIQVDSLLRKIDMYEFEKKELEKENDSLIRLNYSLQFKETTTIYNEIKYKYGKEIKLLDSSGINKYLDILSR
jgi:hypothetical protein